MFNPTVHVLIWNYEFVRVYSQRNAALNAFFSDYQYLNKSMHIELRASVILFMFMWDPC